MKMPDHLPTLLHLASDNGLRAAACDLINGDREAGVLLEPLLDANDLTDVAVGAIDLLLAEIDWRSHWVAYGTPQVIAAKRIRIAASLTGLLLPPVVIDYDRRYALVPDDGGYLPHADEILRLLREAEQRLRAYLAEHDRGEWVDANAVAGAVADIHDSARMLNALLAVGGIESYMDRV